MTTTSAGLREQARQAIANQPFKTVTVLSSLLATQDELGYLPEEAIEEVALLTDSSINTVWGVASFYPNFRFTPPARHIVEVCWGPTCHVLGAQPILQGLMQKLGLEREGDTPDGAISLKLNTCLGVCPHGPAMSVDHHLAGHMSLDKATSQVELLRVEDRAARHDAEMRADEERRHAEAEKARAARQAREASGSLEAKSHAETQAAKVRTEAETAEAEMKAIEKAATEADDGKRKESGK